MLVSMSAQLGKRRDSPEHGERADGRTILVLVLEVRILAVMFSDFGLERATQRRWIIKRNGRETFRHDSKDLGRLVQQMLGPLS